MGAVFVTNRAPLHPLFARPQSSSQAARGMEWRETQSSGIGQRFARAISVYASWEDPAHPGVSPAGPPSFDSGRNGIQYPVNLYEGDNCGSLLDWFDTKAPAALERSQEPWQTRRGSMATRGSMDIIRWVLLVS